MMNDIDEELKVILKSRPPLTHDEVRAIFQAQAIPGYKPTPERLKLAVEMSPFGEEYMAVPRYDYDPGNLSLGAEFGRLANMFKAVACDDVKDIERMLSQFDINNQRSRNKNTILHYAAAVSTKKTIEFILGVPGVNPTLLNRSGTSAAEIAIHTERGDDIKHLLVEAEMNYPFTPK